MPHHVAASGLATLFSSFTPATIYSSLVQDSFMCFVHSASWWCSSVSVGSAVDAKTFSYL